MQMTSDDGATVTKSDLRAREWTETMISRLLGDPDDTRYLHLWGRVSTTMKLYRLDRVEAVEATVEWQEWRDRNRRHRATRTRAAYAAAKKCQIREMRGNPDARHALEPFLDQCQTYSAEYGGLGAHGHLLREVRTGDGTAVTDHVWVRTEDWRLPATPSVGSRFTFSAIAQLYRKGYMGYREDRDRGTAVDIKLDAVQPAEGT